MQPLLNIAVRAARRAADVIVRSLNRLESIEVSTKGRNEYVTEVDRAAEAEIIAMIRRAYPDHAFLGEETGASGSGPVAGITGTPQRSASLRAATLLPSVRITSPGGPTKMMPASAQASANSGRSDRKP